MSLGAVSTKRGYSNADRHALLQELIRSEDNFQQWLEHPSSHIVHHEAPCCEEARLWFLAYARSMEIGTFSQFNIRAPSWLSRLFTWGPSKWPISWCELVEEKTLDCGAFAALAREVFAAQGHSVHPAQALLSYNRACTRHWRKFWNDEKEGKDGVVFPWIGKDIVYHELCLLELENDQAKVYDSTWGIWHEPQSRVGWGALLALRTECPRLLHWGGTTLRCGEWIDL